MNQIQDQHFFFCIDFDCYVKVDIFTHSVYLYIFCIDQIVMLHSICWKAFVFGPILDDRLKEKILKPYKGAHSSHSVCVSVRGLQVTPFGLGTSFLGWVILGTWEKNAFFVFRNFHFYAFYRHFSIFSLYNTSKFLVSSFWSQFFT